MIVREQRIKLSGGHDSYRSSTSDTTNRTRFEALIGDAAVELIKDYLHHNTEHVLYTIRQGQDLRSLPSSYADTDVMTILQELYACFYPSPNAERPGLEDMMVSLRTADRREVFNDQIGRAIDRHIVTVITLTRRVGGEVDFDVPPPSTHRNPAAEYQQWPKWCSRPSTVLRSHFAVIRDSRGQHVSPNSSYPTRGRAHLAHVSAANTDRTSQ